MEVGGRGYEYVTERNELVETRSASFIPQVSMERNALLFSSKYLRKMQSLLMLTNPAPSVVNVPFQIESSTVALARMPLFSLTSTVADCDKFAGTPHHKFVPARIEAVA